MFVFQILSEDSVVVAAKCFNDYPSDDQKQEVIAQCLPEELVFAYNTEQVIEL